MIVPVFGRNASFILSSVELHPSCACDTHASPPTTSNSSNIPTQQVSNKTLEKECSPFSRTKQPSL